VFIIYGLCANAVRKHVINSKKVLRWTQRSFAAIFALLGLKLATADSRMRNRIFGFMNFSVR
jgi:threonine/homoserine/homoserine lactone efflux protein